MLRSPRKLRGFEDVELACKDGWHYCNVKIISMVQTQVVLQHYCTRWQRIIWLSAVEFVEPKDTLQIPWYTNGIVCTHLNYYCIQNVTVIQLQARKTEELEDFEWSLRDHDHSFLGRSCFTKSLYKVTACIQLSASEFCKTKWDNFSFKVYQSEDGNKKEIKLLHKALVDLQKLYVVHGGSLLFNYRPRTWRTLWK